MANHCRSAAYENATRYPFQSPTLPGLDVSGDGRGCNTLTGRFDILEISYASGQISSFAADFEQHCEGGTPALFGSVRYNASVGFPASARVKANGSRTPITAGIGETVNITVETEAGDNQGLDTEYWLARSGPYGTQWFNSGTWKSNKYNLPVLWKKQPLDSNSYNFSWTPQAPGVYMFQFIIDDVIQTKPALDILSVDHVVITVK